ncbi:hypothetical protein BGZ76_002821, partial [Entomortierella beljakovae]
RNVPELVNIQPTEDELWESEEAIDELVSQQYRARIPNPRDDVLLKQRFKREIMSLQHQHHFNIFPDLEPASGPHIPFQAAIVRLLDENRPSKKQKMKTDPGSSDYSSSSASSSSNTNPFAAYYTERPTAYNGSNLCLIGSSSSSIRQDHRRSSNRDSSSPQLLTESMTLNDATPKKNPQTTINNQQSTTRKVVLFDLILMLN